MIESALNNDHKVNTNVLRKTDFSIVKMKLKAIGNVGDMTDQLDIAQLVARHLCTRYHSQFLCLKPKHQDSNIDEYIEKQSSSSSCWQCCCPKKWISSKHLTFFDEKEIIRKISTFAIAVIIQTINSGTIRVSPNGLSARKDALATTLVLIVCQAHTNIDSKFVSPFRYGNENLPLNLIAVSKVGHELNLRILLTFIF